MLTLFSELLGTLANSFAIAVGSILGVLIRGGIIKKYNTTLMHAVSLAVIIIGVRGALKSDDLLLVIISLACGSLLGEWLGIEQRLAQFGRWIELRFSTTRDGLSVGFVNASLVFCVGSMAIVGSLESGLLRNHQTLFAKAIIDGIYSIVFASSMGIGVLFSSISVLLYQGTLTLTASFMEQFLTPPVVSQMSAVGGLLIMAIGYNLLEMNTIKVGNMLPAIFLPLVYDMLKHVLGMF